VGQNLLTYFKNRQLPVESLSPRKEGWKNGLNEDTTVIINLVGKAHDHRKIAKENDYYYANVQLTKEIFKVFLESSAELLIHISSLAALEEYESSRPLTESDNCRPESWYGKSKREAEEWLIGQRLPMNKKLFIIRPPMIHGPGDKGNLRLLYKLICKGIPYPLASFDNKRSFIAIDNFTFLIKQMIDNQSKLSSGLYHVTDDEAISTNDIIEVIKEITGKRVSKLVFPRFLIHGLAKLGDIVPIPLNSKRLKKMTNNLLVSNDKIKSELGISKLPLTAREGISKTIEWFQNKSV
jgi:nucleoside-diphosphate-sugar epimerase